MNILFTVCGRAGSKGIKNKNLRSLLNVPLLYYTLGAIWNYQNSHPEHQVAVAVSSDSQELHTLAHSQSLLSLESVYRNEYLAGDTAPKVSVIAACAKEMEQRTHIYYDLVVDLDITSPLRTCQDIERAIELKQENNNYDCVFSVTSSRRNPYFNMIKIENGVVSQVIESNFTTRQAAPEVYDMNASIYVYDVSALQNKNPVGFFQTNCGAIMMKDTAVLDIDNEEDLELMACLSDYFFQHDLMLSETKKAALTLLNSQR